MPGAYRDVGPACARGLQLCVGVMFRVHAAHGDYRGMVVCGHGGGV